MAYPYPPWSDWHSTSHDHLKTARISSSYVYFQMSYSCLQTDKD